MNEAVCLFRRPGDSDDLWAARVEGVRVTMERKLRTQGGAQVVVRRGNGGTVEWARVEGRVAPEGTQRQECADDDLILNPQLCHELIGAGPWRRQCRRKAWMGPGKLYCKTHAKKQGGPK